MKYKTYLEQFSAKKWFVSSVEDLCKIEKMNSIERKTGASRPQTARSEQNYKHAIELICSQEGGQQKSKRHSKPDSDIS